MRGARELRPAPDSRGAFNVRKRQVLAEYGLAAKESWETASELYGEWLSEYNRNGRPQTRADVAEWRRYLELLNECRYKLILAGAGAESWSVGIMIKTLTMLGEPL